MKRLKIIFETGIIGDLHKNQAGLYRVADELLKGLYYNKEIDLYYSIYAHNRSKSTTKEIEEILSEKEYKLEAANIRHRRKFLAFRKEKLFKYIYKKFDIFDYKIKNLSILKEAQIYHSPYYPIPNVLKKFPNIKKIVTIHDLIPFIFPNYNSDKILMEEIIASIIENEACVICVSESTKNDIIRLVPQINPDKIFVSLLAADPQKFYISKEVNQFSEIQKKFNLPDRYFLGLSTLEPRKNIDHVIRCFVKTITENNIDDMSLVLVGSKGWDYDKIFEEYENAEKFKSKIIITGRVPDEDLASIYSNADAFFYMSLYEGFGLPPLEAMQCGVPTVVSNNSSLPEVVGDAGFLLNPKDEKALSEIMFKLYENEDLRKEYSQKALKQAKKFSWENTLSQHIEIYKKVLNSHSEF